jgi:hypothetical protein
MKVQKTGQLQRDARVSSSPEEFRKENTAWGDGS